MTTLYSRATIGGHPLHAMLIAFPVAFYTSTFATFCAYLATENVFWWRTAILANIAGVVSALIAAVPGFIDWAFGIPRASPAKSTGLKHMLLHVSALVLFSANIFMQRHTFAVLDQGTGFPVAAVILTGLGLGLTLTAGALGWRMVQTYHVGVKLSDEQIAREPMVA